MQKPIITNMGIYIERLQNYLEQEQAQRTSFVREPNPIWPEFMPPSRFVQALGLSLHILEDAAELEQLSSYPYKKVEPLKLGREVHTILQWGPNISGRLVIPYYGAPDTEHHGVSIVVKPKGSRIGAYRDNLQSSGPLTTEGDYRAVEVLEDPTKLLQALARAINNTLNQGRSNRQRATNS